MSEGSRGLQIAELEEALDEDLLMVDTVVGGDVQEVLHAALMARG